MPAVAYETVTVQPTPHSKPRLERISPRVRQAIDLMVHEGQARKDAAKAVGITDEAMRQALKKPQVLAYMNTQMQVIRTSAAAKTIWRVDSLADVAGSEHVQLEANKWLAGLEGISPVSKSESTINHKGLGPGLTIIMAQPEPVLVIDSQAHEVEYVSREKHLSAPVPHPSMRNAQLEAANPRGNQPADRAGGGEKRKKPR